MTTKKAPVKATAPKKDAETKGSTKDETPPPSKPVESKAVTANKTEELPQPASSKKSEDEKMSVDEVAVLLLDGSRKWGTGRDRDTNLASAGYDLDAVRNAVTKERARRATESS